MSPAKSLPPSLFDQPEIENPNSKIENLNSKIDLPSPSPEPKIDRPSPPPENLNSKIENRKSKIENSPGAPRGNLNALKHGFYSAQLKQADLDDLSRLDGEFDLQDEAGLLRVYMRRLVELSSAPQSPQEAASLVRTICLASLTLNRLLKTRAVLHIATRQDRAAITRSLSSFDLALAKLMSAYGQTPSGQTPAGDDDDDDNDDDNNNAKAL